MYCGKIAYGREVYEERQPNGQWLRAIEFKLPIIEHDMKLGLDNGDSVETICLLSRMSNRKPDSYVEMSLDIEDYHRIAKR